MRRLDDLGHGEGFAGSGDAEQDLVALMRVGLDYQLGDSLEGIAPRLRGMEVHIETTDSNLETISQDMMAISRDLEVINSSVAQVAPLLDDYVRLVNEANDAVEQTRANLSRQLDAAKWVAIGMMVWLGLTQVAPLYLGGELITGWRSSS